MMTMALAVALVACSGAVGKTGEAGPQGEPGDPAPPAPPVNLAPIARAPAFDAVMLVEEGDAATIDVAANFVDPEGQALTFAASAAPEEGVITIELANGVLTVDDVAAGTAVITVTATDAGGLTASATINVTVHPEGMAPPTYDESLVDIVALKPGEQRVISGADIENAFHESEGENLDFEASGSDDTIVLVTQADDNTVTITALAVEGDATVTITATDEDDLTVEHVIEVSVRAVLKPALSDMAAAPASLDVGGEQDSRDVSGYFDNHGLADLEYSANSSDDDVAKESIDGSTLMITPMGPGTATVTVTASNVHGSVDLEIMVTVTATPPMPNGEIDDQELMIGESKKILLDQFFTPGAGSTHNDLIYSATSDDETKVTAAVARGSEDLTITGVASGMAMVTVTATDEDGEPATQTIDVTVTEEVAEAPLPTSTEILQAQDLVSDYGSQTIALADHFSGATNYTAASDNMGVLTVSVAGGVLTLTPVSYGKATVTVTPSNNTGNGAPQTFTVTVQAKPMLATGMMFDPVKIELIIDDATADTTNAGAFKRLDLNKYITDPDSTSLTFSTTTRDAETAAVYPTPGKATDATDDAALYAPEGTVAVSGRPAVPSDLDKATTTDDSDVLIRGRKVGTATITVTATDTDGHNATWDFVVTVVAGNSSPGIDANVGTFPGDPGADNPYNDFAGLDDERRFKSTDTTAKRLRINLAGMFSDADIDGDDADERRGDSWMFKAISTATDVATVRLESTGNAGAPDEYNVVVTPVGPGEASVYFVVTDSFGRSFGGETPDEDDADGTLIPNTFFSVRVNNPPVPYSGAGAARKSLSTERKWMALSGEGGDDHTPSSVALIDNPGTADMAEGYFSDKDGDALLCRLMKTTGETVAMELTTRNAFTLQNIAEAGGAAPKTGQTTFRIRCFDQVDTEDFEWAEDTLTVNVAYEQSISD